MTVEAIPTTGFYSELARTRGGDSLDLQQVVADTVEHLNNSQTSTARPGVLFGRIQSGKTRAFLGIIASCFDHGFDGAIVLTKGTKSLSRQTLKRIARDFKSLHDADLVQYFDIMEMQDNLTSFSLDQKLIIVAKKEDDNLKRVLLKFTKTYPELTDRRWLIVDDEADLASVTFRRVTGGGKEVGKLSRQIDALRELLKSSPYLQVTATPYSLFLQPEDDVHRAGELLFRPRRPAFVEVLKPHEAYVGGDYYFEKSDDESSPAYFFYHEVPLPERDALKKEDGRRLKLDDLLASTNAAVLRLALMNFIVGGSILRLLDANKGKTPRKFSFLFHTEQAKASHQWQERVVTELRDQLIALSKMDDPRLDALIAEALGDLKRSLAIAGTALPDDVDITVEVRRALSRGYVMISVVNSDKDVEQMLDDDGELNLQAPFNVFIGGQILDRGITIRNLIGFYYGRNPQKAQQDTVLQHSRMYGAREISDLPVTRFYAPDRVYSTMKRIHDFDAALRDALESADGAPSVYFIMQDPKLRLVPCSPNKILFSDIRAVRPGRRIVPVDFSIVSPTAGKKSLDLLDSAIEALHIEDNTPHLVSLEIARSLLRLAQANFHYDDASADDRAPMIAVLEHLSASSSNAQVKGKVWLLVAGQRDPRTVRRFRAGGRFTDAPDTKQQRDAADSTADAPVLMLLKQQGSKDMGWSGLPFWWPVIRVPDDATTAIFAENVGDAIGDAVAPL